MTKKSAPPSKKKTAASSPDDAPGTQVKKTKVDLPEETSASSSNDAPTVESSPDDASVTTKKIELPEGTVSSSADDAPATPVKKKMALPVRRVKTELPSPKGKSVNIVKVLGAPEPLSFEMYMYEKNPTTDGFTNHIRKYIREASEHRQASHELLDKANFTQAVPRRVPFSENVKMLNASGYFRNIFLRFLGDPANPGVPVHSTPESRKEGLKAFTSFLADKRFSNYPESENMPTEDLTNEEEPIPLDKFLMDETIKECLETDIDLDLLGPGFVKMYPDFAPACWKGPNYSEWAKSIGFGKEE